MIFSRKNPGKNNFSAHEPKIDDIKELLEETPSMPMRNERKEDAPLFVKVDRYKEILTIMQDMKTFISGMKQLFTVIKETDEVRNSALNILHATVQRLERNVIEIDNEMAMPGEVDFRIPHEETEMSHIEESLIGLQRQLADLKRDLQEFK